MTQQPLITAVLQFVWFVAPTVALSVLLGWLMTETGSVPTTMVFHAASNTGYSLVAILGVYTA